MRREGPALPGDRTEQEDTAPGLCALTTLRGATDMRATVDLRSLDCLRGFLAFYVLAGHARWMLWAGHAEWVKIEHSLWANFLSYGSALLRYSHEAVLVFFVLSGFFIHLRAARQLAAREIVQFAVGSYATRRLHRLGPPYAFALVLTLIADLFGRHFWPILYHAQTGDPLLDFNFMRKEYSYASVLPALSFLPSSLGRDFGTNGPLWSLAYEAVYYAAYPAWLLLRRRNAVSSYCVPAVFAILPLIFSIGTFLNGVVGHYYLWIAGAGLAELSCRGHFGRRPILLALLLSAVAVVLHLVPGAFQVSQLLLGCGVVLLFGFGLAPFAGRRWFRALELLGIRSYTIYICHFPMLALLGAWCWAKWSGLPVHGGLAVSGALAVLAACLACFECCERYFLHPRLEICPSATK